eukprot:12554241-Alexandrium_andersonii.AAC.1
MTRSMTGAAMRVHEIGHFSISPHIRQASTSTVVIELWRRPQFRFSRARASAPQERLEVLRKLADNSVEQTCVEQVRHARVYVP